MADPMSEIFNGTPEAIDEEDIRHMDSLSQAGTLPEVEEEPQQTSQESQPTKPQASTEAKPKEQKKEQTSFQDEGFDAGDLAFTARDVFSLYKAMKKYYGDKVKHIKIKDIKTSIFL